MNVECEKRKSNIQIMMKKSSILQQQHRIPSSNIVEKKPLLNTKYIMNNIQPIIILGCGEISNYYFHSLQKIQVTLFKESLILISINVNYWHKLLIIYKKINMAFNSVIVNLRLHSMNYLLLL